MSDDQIDEAAAPEEAFERILRAALADGDVKGVAAALTVLAVRDPRRAQMLFDSLRGALDIADTVRSVGVRAGDILEVPDGVDPACGNGYRIRVVHVTPYGVVGPRLAADGTNSRNRLHELVERTVPLDVLARCVIVRTETPKTKPVTTLIITRGLPASGKTTRARDWVGSRPLRVRLSRDDLRTQMFGGWTGYIEHETAVTAVQHAAIRAALNGGCSVVADDTNLRAEYVQALSAIARQCGAHVEVWDMTDVPVDECIARDCARAARGEAAAGAHVIRKMHADLLTDNPSHK